MANSKKINIIEDFLGIGLIKCNYSRSFKAIEPVSLFASADASNERDNKVVDFKIKVNIKFDDNCSCDFVFLAQFSTNGAKDFKDLKEDEKQIALRTMFSISFPFARQTITNLMTDSFGAIQLPLINILEVADITKGVVFIRNK